MKKHLFVKVSQAKEKAGKFLAKLARDEKGEIKAVDMLVWTGIGVLIALGVYGVFKPEIDAIAKGIIDNVKSGIGL